MPAASSISLDSSVRAPLLPNSMPLASPSPISSCSPSLTVKPPSASLANAILSALRPSPVEVDSSLRPRIPARPPSGAWSRMMPMTEPAPAPRTAPAAASTRAERTINLVRSLFASRNLSFSSSFLPLINLFRSEFSSSSRLLMAFGSSP